MHLKFTLLSYSFFWLLKLFFFSLDHIWLAWKTYGALTSEILLTCDHTIRSLFCSLGRSGCIPAEWKPISRSALCFFSFDINISVRNYCLWSHDFMHALVFFFRSCVTLSISAVIVSYVNIQVWLLPRWGAACPRYQYPIFSDLDLFSDILYLACQYSFISRQYSTLSFTRIFSAAPAELLSFCVF